MHNQLTFGFKQFVLAHEYAHCIRGHLDQLEGRSSLGYAMRSSEEIKEAQRIYDEKYAHMPLPDDLQFHSFCQLHALEFDADSTAVEIVLAPWLRNDPTLEGPARLILLGIYLFLWYAEIMDRIRRTISVGNTWFENPIYGEDIIVDELLHRRTHPAPLSRINGVTAALLRQNPSNEPFCNAVKITSDWARVFFELTWRNHRSAIAQLIGNLNCKIHPKFIDSIPFPGLMLGISN